MAKNKNHHLRKIADTWYFEKMVNGRRIKKALSKSLTESRKLRDHHLKEILIHGDIEIGTIAEGQSPLFGEIAKSLETNRLAVLHTSTLKNSLLSWTAPLSALTISWCRSGVFSSSRSKVAFWNKM